MVVQKLREILKREKTKALLKVGIGIPTIASLGWSALAFTHYEAFDVGTNRNKIRAVAGKDHSQFFMDGLEVTSLNAVPVALGWYFSQCGDAGAQVYLWTHPEIENNES